MKSYLIALFLLFSLSSEGQVVTDIQELTQNSLSNKSDQRGLGLCIWLSDYLWEYSARNAPGIDQSLLEDIIRIMKGYNIFGVAVGKRDMNEIVRFPDEEAILSTIVLIGQDSVEYYPIPEDELSEEISYVLRVSKPMYAQLMGQLGENMHLVAFKKRNDKGELIADPTKEKNVQLHAAGIDFEWRLPMSALVAKKKCPEDEEVMNGTWKYCPYHGNELEAIEE